SGGRPVLLDFNLSVDEGGASYLRGGTVPYMAPEQLRGLGHADRAKHPAPDPRSDLYALGTILYELLAGPHPLDPLPHPPPPPPLELGQLLQEHQTGDFPPLRQINPRVHRGLARIIERCLAVRPGDRPQTAVEVARVLRAIPLGRRLRRWAAAHPRRAVA